MGRHKAFCVEHALASALDVFWRRGYEGASLSELTAAMGITRPSLYATYGNKEELFRKALDLYEASYLGFCREALTAASSHEVVARLFAGYIELATDGEHPPGCMGTQGALVCSTAADPIKEELVRRRCAFEELLVERLERAQADGDLPAGENPAALARFVMTFSCGLAVQAASGASRTSLLKAADMALRSWPRVVAPA